MNGAGLQSVMPLVAIASLVRLWIWGIIKALYRSSSLLQNSRKGALWDQSIC